MKILHVVGTMNPGGTETWLLNVLRHIDRDAHQLSFCTFGSNPGIYAEEIVGLGGQIIPCLLSSNLLSFIRRFHQILRQGHYDLVHGHVHYFSGLIMKLSYDAGVRIRIAHAHTGAPERAFSPSRKLYATLMKQAIHRYATHGIAASQEAASILFGPLWKNDPRWRIVYCGIDLEPFRQRVDRFRVRSELGIPLDAKVVGHVGRFLPVKNHSLLVDIAVELQKCTPNVWFILVGDGPQRIQIQDQVRQLSLADRFIFTGVRSDIPRLMQGAMDVFCMPSRFEGLPLVVLECQAAALPVVLSDVITSEVTVLPHLITRCSLESSPKKWAALVAEALEKPRIPHTEAIAVMENSPFNIVHSVSSLLRIYQGDSE